MAKQHPWLKEGIFKGALPLTTAAMFDIKCGPVLWRIHMSRLCIITGKAPQSGHRVSHANNKTKHKFLPNLQTHRYWVPSLNKFIKLRVSAKAMRTIDKKGIEVVLQELVTKTTEE